MKHRKFYKISNDLMFKAIFGNEKKKYLLERLIKEATGIDANIIKFKVSELVKNNVQVKNKILDIIALSNNEELDIELNNYYDDYIRRRNTCYICRMYSDYSSIGESYDKMKRIIQINIINKADNIYDTDEFVIYSPKTNRQMVDNFQIFEINLHEIKKLCYNV